jgi:hypothetical protein
VWHQAAKEDIQEKTLFRLLLSSKTIAFLLATFQRLAIDISSTITPVNVIDGAMRLLTGAAGIKNARWSWI